MESSDQKDNDRDGRVVNPVYGPHEVVDFLNSILEIDEQAIRNMWNAKVPCSKELAEHPTVIVGNGEDPETYCLTFLGLINGVFGFNKEDIGSIGLEMEVDEFDHWKAKKLHRFLVVSEQERSIIDAF